MNQALAFRGSSRSTLAAAGLLRRRSHDKPRLDMNRLRRRRSFRLQQAKNLLPGNLADLQALLINRR